MSHDIRIDDATQAAASMAKAVTAVGNFLKTGDSQADVSCEHSHLEMIASILADYAWKGDPIQNGHIEDTLAELAVAVELLNANFMLPDGTEWLSVAEKEAIQRLANAADARWQLDQGESIRVEQLAALAGVAEKTVRAATNPKSANPLPVTKDGYWTLIKAKDALVWLGRRNDFMPTRIGTDGLEQPQITDSLVLAGACKTWRLQADQSIEQVSAALNWSDAQLDAYRDIESGAPSDVIAELPPQVLHQLALRLKLPDPASFARQAYAVLALAHAVSLSDRQIAPAA